MPESKDKTRIRVKYDAHSALYANQVILNGSPDELFLDFSSGPIQDPETGDTVVPVHTRIAMTPSGARRLVAALQQSLRRGERVSESDAK